MQDDTFLAGSIADNICFFDLQPNYLEIEQCAKLAAIDADIGKMTMGHNSLDKGKLINLTEEYVTTAS